MRRGPTRGSALADAAAINATLRPLAQHRRFIIAASGGPDSLALMIAAGRWAAARDREACVVTVDHRLRRASASEAAFVAEAAARLGLPHHTLNWDAAKPAAGVQNAARAARYALIADFARAGGYTAVATGHTLDDQAETVLMRLARGGGVDGLSAMAIVTPLCEGVDLVRPFLSVSKAEITAYLRRRGERWMTDPSNEDVRFERVRIRRALRTLRGLGVDARAIAASAARLGRARRALHILAAEWRAAAGVLHPEGWLEFDAAAFRASPAEIVIHAMTEALEQVSGGGQPRLSKVEASCAQLQAGRRGKRTLGGCVIELSADRVSVRREEGRMRGHVITLQPGASAVWDGRFLVSLAPECPEPVSVAALGAHARDLPGLKTAPPRDVLRATPAFFAAGRLVAAPVAAAAPDAGSHALARFCRAELRAFPPARVILPGAI
ncbi:MAG: tRNA lysidine(34) synthetase TilS [Hyphomicrobiales bacterium]|nr:tRNA lysidine(34) synthetase TilS [Hyphomicrobiales bacterium]